MLSALLAVVLAGCGGASNDGPTVPSIQLSASSPATSPSAFNGTLDDATAAWFGAFCAASSSVDEQAQADYPAVTGGSAGSTAGSPVARQAAAKEAYGRLAATFAAASAQVTSIPPPNLGNLPTSGPDYAAAMKEAGTALADAGAQIGAATVTDDASFETAATQTFSSLQAKLVTIKDRAAAIRSGIDPALSTAVRDRFPECAGLE